MKKYGVIYADPPWDYKNGGNGRARAYYNTMKDDEICALKVADVSNDDAVLLLWATWPKLDVAMRVIAEWGFQFKSGFPWVKVSEPPFCDMFGEINLRPCFGTGFWARGCSEPILIAKRGDAEPPNRPWLGLISNRMQHSRKPDDIYQYAESFPGPYLEMFCRRPRAGWDVFGNEVEHSIKL